jgi:TRAP-type C4-dicarboxylate transport system permease small subunit
MLKILRQSVAALLATAFALMFAIFIAQIVARYFFNAPLTWTEEAIRILYIWIIFGSVGTIVAWRDHVSIDFLLLATRGHLRRALMLVSRACVLVILVISVPDTLDYLDYMRRIPTGVMRLPTGLVFGVYMVFCVGLPLKIAIDIRRILSDDRDDAEDKLL